MDISVMLMIFTCKFTSFAFDYSDGCKDMVELSQGMSFLKWSTIFSIDQNERKINNLPSFKDYCAYVFFFAGSVAGPTFGYKEFEDFIHNRKQYKEIPLGIMESFKNLIISACFIFSVVVLMPVFPPQYLTLSKFHSHSFVYQMLYVTISLGIIRCRYYGAWALSQSTMSACGLSYAGISENGSEMWDKVQTADPMLEIYPSPKDKQDV